MRESIVSRFALGAIVCLVGLSTLATRPALAQGSDTALLRGAVTDSSGAAVPGAQVTLTDLATGVSGKAITDGVGRYTFNALKPSTYSASVEAQGFKTSTQTNITLRVGQQSDLSFALEIGSATQTIEVKSDAALLNTVSGALGAEVTNKYIVEMPLLDRNVTSLAFLAPGVTEVTGTKVADFGGTMFSSNGQRYATAEFRLDGGIASHPEGGEGGTTFVGYLPTVEAIQEFKVQTNSFSAEYGNNGGTVVSMITKSGSNQFHGSGWYFFRRPGMDANDFFANRDCPAPGDPSRPDDGCKGSYAHDQYGASLGGPIKRQKSFFFTDFERLRHNVPFTINTTVPTDLQKKGDFSKTFNSDGALMSIYNPCPIVHASASDPTGRPSCSVTPVLDGGEIVDYKRAPFPGNVIPASLMDPVMLKAIALYPSATSAGDPDTGANNYSSKLVDQSHLYKLDGKIDHYFSDTSRIAGRYSRSRSDQFTPNPFLSNNDNLYNSDGVTLDHTWTPRPTLMWTNRATFTRYANFQHVPMSADPDSIGFPTSLTLNPAFRQKNFPSLYLDNYQGLNADVSTNTIETDTQYSFNSLLTKIAGSHNMKFGADYRIFLNTFFQPANTAGGLNFGAAATAQSVYDPNTDAEGNAVATMLLGYMDSGAVSASPAVANRSSESSFFFQDDWRVTSKLTINLGLRYEWSTPYTERYDRSQFTCLSCDSGITVPGLGAIKGTTIMAGKDLRRSTIDKNNIAPRIGFAYSPDQKTVIRGGAGVYYGLSYATNWQYAGASWLRDIAIQGTKDGGVTQFATIENPFPVGFVLPPGNRYGALAEWGYPNYNHASIDNRNAEIYQWNLGVQRQMPGGVVVEASYSANRSTHLPWKKNPQNYNVLSRAAREQYGISGLNQQVANPFQYLFQGPNAIFDSPDSIYNDPTIARINLLRPYPQFPGYFGGYPPFAASSLYNSLQMRFEKRASHGVSFTGAYTFSHFVSTSDEGANRWVGRISQGEPQDLTNLAAEKSISANDTPHRLALATVYELPIGHGRALGSGMPRLLDAFIGGWKLNAFLTLQSGQPITVLMRTNRLSGGVQRPNISGDPRSQYSNHDVVDGAGSFFNTAAFSAPGEQVPGNAPRYLDAARVDGIRNLDLGIGKILKVSEGRYFEVRGEFFNALNTPRFGQPNTSYGAAAFGTIASQANQSRHGQLGLRFVY
ncbi:MAG: TonB-dependent receptor [Paludibaculum sp.]